MLAAMSSLPAVVDGSPRSAGTLAVTGTDIVAEAQKVTEEFSALASCGSPGNRAYLERLSKAAAEAAAKGYGVKRMTHTMRRTRVRKTMSTTDMRTMETETNTEERATVDSWMEEGSPALSGVGVVCARGRRVLERYSDGSEAVQDVKMKGGAMFWPGGDASSVQTTTFNHRATNGYGADPWVHWGGAAAPQVQLPQIAAA